jgi:DNA polymerase I-like protein with 3'-5' exonuclease and polymerase domains
VGTQGSLFDIGREMAPGNWKPPSALPEIRGKFDRIGFDCETTGKDKYKDKQVGIALGLPDGKRYYIPTGHLAGGNLDKGLVRRWAQAELRDVKLIGLNIGFDAEMMLNDGIDLEAQGCTLRDVAHSAALLDENRYSGFNLDSLGMEYVGHGKKPMPVHPGDLHKVHSSLVGEYAEEDGGLSLEIGDVQEPQLVEQDLLKVQELEDDLIWANNHMERNGARIDRPKLERWLKETKERFGNLILEIHRQTGIRVNPNSPDDLSKLFKHLGLENTALSAGGDESFTKASLSKVDNKIVQMALKARQLAGIQSKLKNYHKRLDDNDVLRFQLYQLRAAEGDYGTVSGRYSSANLNIQQIFKVERQIEEFGDEYIIRELFIPDEGMDMFSGDASQIEFRLFAHYSGSSRLIQAYKDDPKKDFHQMVADMLGQTRTKAKGNNFGKLYGMGRKKLARQLGLSCVCGCPDKYAWDNDRHDVACPMIIANELADQYDNQFPEAKRLMNTAMKLAETRKFVRTLLGRRRRYPDGKGLHAALNSVIQGSAADVFKMKVRQLYRERKTIGIHKLRYPVHDEEVGDIIRDVGARLRLHECFAADTIPLKVPVLWDLEFGANWRECA